MTDREKVIKGLQCCSVKGMNTCELQECPYYPERYEWNRCTNHLATDTLVLLKAMKKQEPILLENQHKPFGYNTNANSPWISRCPRCGKKVEGKQTRFCKYCGQAVKWDG